MPRNSLFHSLHNRILQLMAACYNLKHLAKFLDDGLDAFYNACPLKSEVCLQGVNA